ncbi:MAG TPA: sulfotransferase [Candidatus Thermoplasmatota archaeon]|nr:sulfotransferase [Candidatus Thermoplasmatota archaeon]
MEFDNLKQQALYVKNTPLPGYTFPNFLYLLAQNKFKIDAQYIPRMVYSFTLSTIMLPFYIKERLQFDKRIEQTEITHPPLFIIGHWRSGTTYLQNVLSQDKNLGYLTTFQAYLPGVFLGSEKIFKPLVSSSIPKKRPMDDVLMDADYPQEDQYAIGAFSPYSYYHGWCFPKNMEFYNTSVCMDDVPKETIDEWKAYYLYILKKITLYRHGKQLVLKNQDNTGKIKILLEMFPDAKFIFLYRNPYDLYFSMMKFMRIAIPRFCIQKPPRIEVVEESMMNLYTKIIQKYIKERVLIPKGNLVEVRYEDFVTQPFQEIKNIYNTLQLEGFRDAEPAFDTYLRTQLIIKKNQYTLNDELKQKIKEKWGFALREFRYENDSI